MTTNDIPQEKLDDKFLPEILTAHACYIKKHMCISSPDIWRDIERAATRIRELENGTKKTMV